MLRFPRLHHFIPRLVLLRGNAPRSLGYQPSALLLSYRRSMAEGVGSAPTSVFTDPVFETGAASLYLPAFLKCRIQNDECRMNSDRVGIFISPFCILHFALKNGCQDWTRTNTERLNRPPCYFDTTWQWHCRQDSHLHVSA